MEMEQLKSHFRTGRQNFILRIYFRFLSCEISVIVLPTLPSPSSAVLPNVLPNPEGLALKNVLHGHVLVRYSVLHKVVKSAR